MTEIVQAPPLLSWRPRSVLVVFAIWTGLGVLSVCHGIVAFQQAQRPFDLVQYAPGRFLDWYTCAVFTPLYVYMARHWPIERRRMGARIALWVAVTAAVVPLKYALQHVATLALLPSMPSRPLGNVIVTSFIPETIAFWAMAGVILSIEYYDRLRHREVQAQALGRQLAESRLEALSSQLRPHFLFNTLQGISTLLHRDPRAADQMLTRLSDLLRQSLRQSDTHEVPLSTELSTLEDYLAIQRIRFQDRLHVSVESDGVGEALVPHFILQPLAENAIEHGIAKHSGPGTVAVAARVRGSRLVIEISNDGGTGEGSDGHNGAGVGLANTRARLEAMYGTSASLVTSPSANGKFLATITLPFKRK